MSLEAKSATWRDSARQRGRLYFARPVRGRFGNDVKCSPPSLATAPNTEPGFVAFAACHVALDLLATLLSIEPGLLTPQPTRKLGSRWHSTELTTSSSSFSLFAHPAKNTSYFPIAASATGLTLISALDETVPQTRYAPVWRWCMA